MKSSEKETKELQINYSRLNDIHKALKDLLCVKFTNDIYQIKNEVNSLKRNVNYSILTIKENLQKELKKIIIKAKELEVTLTYQTTELIRKEKTQLNDELLKTIYNKENEYAEKSMNINRKYEVMIKEKNAEIKQYQNLCDDLEAKNKQLFKNLSEVQSRLKFQEDKCNKLESDNIRLKQEIKHDNEKLAELKTEIKEQTSRLRIDAENGLMTAKHELSNRYKDQLNNFLSELISLKQESNNQLLQLLGSLNNLKLQYKCELEQTIQNYENEVSQLRYSLNKEKDNTRILEEEYNKLQQELSTTRDEHKSEMIKLESQVNYLNQSIQLDEKKLNKLEVEKEEEIKEISKRFQDIVTKLDYKNKL